MNIFDILDLLLGLSFFLFGIRFMGQALEQGLEGRQNAILQRLTEKPSRGFWIGLFVTAMIQSSSATTVMTVGLVHSGAMGLSNAVGVIFGANVGTSVTAWLTATTGLNTEENAYTILQWLKPSSLVPVLSVVSFVLCSSAKKQSQRRIGDILFGFCILMVGMMQMSDAVSGLKDNEIFRSILITFENPFLGILAGAVVTAILQSSSASIGILQSLTATGAVTFGNAIPIIMGQNIGTCITAGIAAAGAGKEAKRVAMLHLLFNVLGTVVCILLFYFLRMMVNFPFLTGSIDVWGIALVHLLFNVISVIVLYPFKKHLVRLSCRLIPNSKAS